MRALALNEIGAVSGGLMWGDEPMDEVTIRASSGWINSSVTFGARDVLNDILRGVDFLSIAILLYEELSENERKLAERDFTTQFDESLVVRAESLENFFGDQIPVLYYADGTYWIDANQNGIFESHFSNASGTRMLDSDNNGTFETPMTRSDWTRGY